jgi:hypothetical protein
MRWIRHARPDVYERTTTLEPMDFVAMLPAARRQQCAAFMSLMTDNRRLNVTGMTPHCGAIEDRPSQVADRALGQSSTRCAGSRNWALRRDARPEPAIKCGRMAGCVQRAARHIDRQHGV